MSFFFRNIIDCIEYFEDSHKWVIFLSDENKKLFNYEGVKKASFTACHLGKL